MAGLWDIEGYDDAPEFDANTAKILDTAQKASAASGASLADVVDAINRIRSAPEGTFPRRRSLAKVLWQTVWWFIVVWFFAYGVFAWLEDLWK